MKKLTIFCFLVVSVLSFVTCKKKNNTSAYSPTCSGTKSFNNDVKPLMQGNCVNCHSGYGSYSGVKASAASIRSSIVSGSMPKGNSLTDDQKNNIVCWIDAGMPNN